MELCQQLALGAVVPVAADPLAGRLPGIAMFAAGLLAGALIVAVASWLGRPRSPGRSQLAAAPVARPRPYRQPTAGREPDRGEHCAVAAGQAGDTAAGRGQQPGLLIGVLGPLTINGQAGALVPAQSQLIVALALNRGGLSNGQLRGLLGADEGHPKPADSLRQLIARTRRALGQAADGREWIEHLGHGRYALHPHAWVDWREFETLAAAGIATGDAASALGRARPHSGAAIHRMLLLVARAGTDRLGHGAHRRRR